MKDELTWLLSYTGDVALRRRARWLIENLNLSDGLKVLDVGCGDGYYLHLLSSLRVKLSLTGLDSDKKALESAKKNLLGKKIRLVYDKAEELPFKSNSFDRIIASEVLEHIEDDVQAIREIRRVLKPRGIFVVSVPHSRYPFLWDPVNWILERTFNTHVKSGFFAGIWNQHIRLYSNNELIKLLKKSGLKKVNTELLTHYCLPFNHYLINIIARLLARKSIDTRKKSFLSKFNIGKRKTSFVFKVIFVTDSLNEYWNGKGSGVSLVAKAVK